MQPAELAREMAALYMHGTAPPQNSVELVATTDFTRLAPLAVVYYSFGTEERARTLATEREPVNLSGQKLYSVTGLQELMGHCESGYSRLWLLHGKLPPLISAYCRTPLVSGDREVHVINSIGAALDEPTQPDYTHYNHHGFGLVRAHMAQTFRMVLRCADDHHLARVAVACVGGGAFSQLYPGDYLHEVMAPALGDALADSPRPKVIGVLGGLAQPELANAVRAVVEAHGVAFEALGHVPQALDRDDTLYQNAWDPHSMVGNGNAGDRSLDGFFGRSTCMHFLCWPPTNPAIKFVEC